MRRLEQHLLIQEQDARQPRLALEEADGPANTKRGHGGRCYSSTSDASG